MSIVRFFKHEPRLAKLMTAPGGKTIGAAIEDAEAELSSVADVCRKEIDRLIGEVVIAGGDQDHGEALYAAAREIAGLATIAKWIRVGEAAHSLCVLVDNANQTGRWRTDAIAVHISTLQLLRGLNAETQDEIAAKLVASLQDMVFKIGDDGRTTVIQG